MPDREIVVKFHRPGSRLSGVMVPDCNPDDADLVFVGGSPSAIDAIRGAPLSGPARETMLKTYLPAVPSMKIGVVNLVPVHLVAKDGRPREPSLEEAASYAWGEGQVKAPMVALGKGTFETLKGLGHAPIAWVPHPLAVRIYKSDDQVISRLGRVIKKLKNLTIDKACAESKVDHRCANAETAPEVKILSKANEEQRLAVGIVLEPMVEDSQHDIETPKEIEKAAHRWLVESRALEEQHDRDVDSQVVESYIAPVDFTLGGSMVSKGSWVVVSKHSKAIWAKIKKGEIIGYSIRGLGKRTPAQKPRNVLPG